MYQLAATTCRQLNTCQQKQNKLLTTKTSIIVILTAKFTHTFDHQTTRSFGWHRMTLGQEAAGDACGAWDLQQFGHALHMLSAMVVGELPSYQRFTYSAAQHTQHCVDSQELLQIVVSVGQLASHNASWNTLHTTYLPQVTTVLHHMSPMSPVSFPLADDETFHPVAAL